MIYSYLIVLRPPGRFSFAKKSPTSSGLVE